MQQEDAIDERIFEENDKFKVVVTYTDTKGAYYHFSAKCVSRTEKFVTFKIDDKAASMLHLSKLQVRRKCFEVNGVENGRRYDSPSECDELLNNGWEVGFLKTT